MVDDELHLTKPVSGRVLQASGDVNSLASATHCFMSPLCYSRSFRRAIMEAVRRSRALRCLTTYRAPIELRQLNGTGFALMCSVTRPDVVGVNVNSTVFTPLSSGPYRGGGGR